MSQWNKQLGNKGEKLAKQLLQQKKLKILSTNLRTKFGEIDILAEDGQTLVVVEVKTKSSDRFGSALEMITPAKRRKLVLLACELQMKFQRESVRIDVVTIDQATTEEKAHYYKGIIEYNGQ